MLKVAQLYESELRTKFLETWNDLSYMYFSSTPGDTIFDIDPSTVNGRDFVSIDKAGNVIGSIRYSIDWIVLQVTGIAIISFDKGNMIFVDDIIQAIDDIFNKYNLNRIEFCCFEDNPAIKGYRKFIKRFGGREVSYKRQCARLADGKLHNLVEFEILAEEYHNPIKELKARIEVKEKESKIKLDEGKYFLKDVADDVIWACMGEDSYALSHRMQDLQVKYKDVLDLEYNHSKNTMSIYFKGIPCPYTAYGLTHPPFDEKSYYKDGAIYYGEINE